MPIPTVDSEFNLRLKAEDELYRWRQRADRRLELMRQVEWIYKTGHKFCPICFSYKRNGHANDCELAKELADAEKES